MGNTKTEFILVKGDSAPPVLAIQSKTYKKKTFTYGLTKKKVTIEN